VGKGGDFEQEAMEETEFGDDREMYADAESRTGRKPVTKGCAHQVSAAASGAEEDRGKHTGGCAGLATG